MNTWFRKVGVGAVALTLAGVLGGCNNGSGGGGLIQLFFGINGNGNCTQVIVTVDLEAAGAIIARDDVTGALDCALNSSLDAAGCEIDYDITEGGDLVATISDCTIPAVTNLFSCMFEDVDISELQETASAICACKTEGCDGNPPVCISEDPDPTSCEDCTNGRDDDGNGLTDCEDPNCRNSPACQETTTTSTTSTSVTVSSTTTTDTVTTSSSTTTSTTNPLDLSCRVVFTLEDDVTAGALQFDVDYSDVPGTLPGTGSSAQCAKLIPTALFALNDVDATETATMGFVDLDGMSGPNLDLAECQFKASATPLKSDFAITVTDATDASDDGLPIEPLPTVKVGTISCEGPEPTTTLPVVTTTTLDVVTTTTIDTVTTTTLGGGGAQNYDIMFTLATSSAAVSSLQFDINYASATGGFEGSGSTVKCTKQVVTALFAPNDVEASSTLTLGLVDLDGFSAPKDVAKCTFNGDAGDPPLAGDFVITIVDSTNADGDPVDSTVTATVTVAP